MSSCVLRKLGLAAASIAFAGALAVLAALANSLSPRGTFVGFVARLAPVALALPALMVGFLTLCDGCLQWLGGCREERMDDRSQPRPTHDTSRDDRFGSSVPKRGHTEPSPEEEPVSLRFARAHRLLGRRSWIGQ